MIPKILKNNEQIYSITHMENKTANTAPVTTTQSEQLPSEKMMETLIQSSKSLAAQYKIVSQTLKSLKTQMKKDYTKILKTKKKRKVNQTPQKVTPEMTKFMKLHTPQKFLEGELKCVDHNDGGYTRQGMMKVVSYYCTSNGIQNEANKKEWNGNDKVLKSLFGLKEPWYNFMNINGLLSRVVIKDKK